MVGLQSHLLLIESHFSHSSGYVLVLLLVLLQLLHLPGLNGLEDVLLDVQNLSPILLDLQVVSLDLTLELFDLGLILLLFLL